MTTSTPGLGDPERAEDASARGSAAYPARAVRGLRAEQNDRVTDRLFLRIVRGEPTAEELAALVAVLAARAAAAGAAAARPRPRSAWAEPAARLRAPLAPGPAAWRRSALPL